MRWLLVLTNALGEVKAWAHCRAHKIDDIARYGGGEHEVLAFNYFRVWEELLDVIDFLGETVIKQAIGFVHDQCMQIWGFDTRVVI